jgi:hypothetical protein
MCRTDALFLMVAILNVRIPQMVCGVSDLVCSPFTKARGVPKQHG